MPQRTALEPGAAPWIGQARTSMATSVKWHAAAATVIACHTSWYPNTSGRGFGRWSRSPIAPRV